MRKKMIDDALTDLKGHYIKETKHYNHGNKYMGIEVLDIYLTKMKTITNQNYLVLHLKIIIYNTRLFQAEKKCYHLSNILKRLNQN